MITLEDIFSQTALLEKECPDIKETDYSIQGLIQQLKKPSEHKEIMLLYVEKENDHLLFKKVWLNKITKQTIEEPQWFKERKEILSQAKEKGII